MKRNNKYYRCLLSVGMFLILTTAAYLAFSTESSRKSDNSLPDFATKNSKVEEAYLFATYNPTALNGVDCHCGCMRTLHEGRLHKRGLLDCFKKDNGEYDIHGSGCAMCIIYALKVKDLTSKGKPKEEIKGIINSKYA